MTAEGRRKRRYIKRLRERQAHQLAGKLYRLAGDLDTAFQDAAELGINVSEHEDVAGEAIHAVAAEARGIAVKEG